MTIKTIIFDVGGVLTNKDWNKINRSMLKKYNFSVKISDYPGLMEKYYMGLHIGKISFNEVMKVLSKKKKINLILKDYVLLHKKYTKINYRLYALLKKLKKNYKLYCLTDINDLHYKLNKKEGIYSPFVKTYASCKIGLKKPDLRCFRLILKNHNLNPREVLFIDDRIENLISAKKLGMKAILFRKNNQLINDLNKLGIKI
jgi:epoxide hydrolase-like predicted phosphatase